MIQSINKSTPEEEADNIEKIALVIGCDKYDLFRLIDGCGNLQDLHAVMLDLNDVFKIIDSMGITNDTEHRIICINPTKEKLQQAYK